MKVAGAMEPMTTRERTKLWIRYAEEKSRRAVHERNTVARAVLLLDGLTSAQIATAHLLTEVVDELLTMQTARMPAAPD